MSSKRGHTERIGRRTYLAGLGATVLGASATTTAAASAYDTVTVEKGTRHVHEIDAGETLENTVFDVTAPGAGVTIIARETDWTIRNVAVEGTVDMGNATILGVADTDGGTSHIENVYLGDGSVYEEKGATGVWVDPDHDGHLEIDRVNVQEMSDNAFYCSAPGTDWGRGGTVALRDCYAANSWVSQYRVAEGSLENCVAAVTDDREYRRGRGLWAWSPGPVDVDGCQFAMNGHHYSFVAGANEEGSRIDVRDTEWDDEFHGGWNTYGDGTVNFKSGNGNDPRNVVPKKCPSSVEDALETSDESPVDDDVYDAVAGLSGGDDDRVTGADLTLLRGRLIDGDNEIDGVTVTGSDLTLLRGYLLDRS
ncbi:hypothetical protein [Natrialba swarupiae]|uniref:hypothetical protein n=1 Tax=Natrialba swarupiae TaxID=2448032 RepID=UPI00192E36EE|nr:hypothetical protein [Natrialba swarupiae]